MATTYLPPVGIEAPTIPAFTLPTSATTAAESTVIAPPIPLPGTPPAGSVGYPI